VLEWSVGDLGPGETWEAVITTTAPASAGVVTNTALADTQQEIMTQTVFATQVVTSAAILRSPGVPFVFQDLHQLLGSSRLDSAKREPGSQRRKTAKGSRTLITTWNFRPWSGCVFESDAKYGPQEGNFKEVNVDLETKLGNDRSFYIGQRYERNGGKALTTQFTWRINPKWKFRIYERYQFSEAQGRGLEEQEQLAGKWARCLT
jgi:hypothetical protein